MHHAELLMLFITKQLYDHFYLSESLGSEMADTMHRF